MDPHRLSMLFWVCLSWDFPCSSGSLWLALSCLGLSREGESANCLFLFCFEHLCKYNSVGLPLQTITPLTVRLFLFLFVFPHARHHAGQAPKMHDPTSAMQSEQAIGINGTIANAWLAVRATEVCARNATLSVTPKLPRRPTFACDP